MPRLQHAQVQKVHNGNKRTSRSIGREIMTLSVRAADAHSPRRSAKQVQLVLAWFHMTVLTVGDREAHYASTHETVWGILRC